MFAAKMIKNNAFDSLSIPKNKSEEYNIDILNAFILSLFKKHLTTVESEVLRLSYGLDCDKHSANDIADKLGIEGASAYVRISEIKKQNNNKKLNSSLFILNHRKRKTLENRDKRIQRERENSVCVKEQVIV